MSTTLETLEKRVWVLEQEVASLRQLVGAESVKETAAERGARLLAQALRDKPQQRVAAAKAFGQIGTLPEPTTPEKLRALMAALGVKSEDNLFSRAIAEMREE